MKALFIPTALNTPEMKEAIPIFLEDLYCLGVLYESITTYNLEKPFTGNIEEYDVILFTAGDPVYLMERVNAVDFRKELNTFLASGGIFIGISAGSDIAAGNLDNGLRYIPAKLECHSKDGTPEGSISINDMEVIELTDDQALVVEEEKIYICK